MATIIVVEDDLDINDIETIALRNIGYDVISCTCAREFWENMGTCTPDLVILDIMLEDEDGLTILDKLRHEDRTSALPVIFVTAKSTELDKVRGLDGGADDYLTKPFGIMELISRVKAVLRRSERNVQAEVNEVGRLRLDLLQRRVYVDDEEIMLTFKEFELLRYLVAHRGAAIPRSELMDKIWGIDFEGESRTLDVHIMTLRKKLGAAGDYIRTVKNVGYRIEEERN